MNRTFRATLLSIAIITGCAGADSTNDETLSESSAALVIEHGADELQALAHDELLRLDLTSSDTIHVLNFVDAADLASVRLVTVDEEWALDELVDTLDLSAQRLVLGADQEAVDAYYASLAEKQAHAVDPRGVVVQGLRKVREVNGCVDPTGIGPVVCD